MKGGLSMPEILVEVTRGVLTESVHRGDIAVVDRSGKVLYYAGDPYKLTCMRSAAKPIQVLPVILSGAAERFGFTDAEISLMCASHYGENFHVKTVEEILKKIGLGTEDLLCGTTTSINASYALELARSGVELTPAHCDCSGKHGGILAICVHKGYDLKSYNMPSHQVQKEILESVAYMCGLKPGEIILGMDGCTVPVFGMPLYNMALAFARLVNPDGLDKNYKDACGRVFKAMNSSPEMVSGTEGFCSELIKNTNGKLVGKIGAEAVYCVGIKQKGIGIAVKIEDGNVRAIPAAVMQALKDLDILSLNELENLKKFLVRKNLNNIKQVIGEIRPAYHLCKKID
jgi:L-asparaginase II